MNEEAKCKCPTCEGKGWLTKKMGSNVFDVDCSECKGAGTVEPAKADRRAVGPVTGGGGALAVSAEAQARWRALVKPIFLEMYKNGIGEIRIKREGAKVRFELSLDVEGPGE